MASLPIEMWWKIAEYLTPKEIAACCTVSRRWRTVFSHDCVWKTHCNPMLEEDLRTTPCLVEPKFVSPELEDSTLSPVGHWRLAFMRENHLWNNWQLANCHFKIIADIDYVEEGDSPFDFYGFLGNDHVIVTNQNGCIDLWDLLMLSKRRSVIKSLPNFYYRSVNNNLGIFVRISGIQVIFFDDSANDINYKAMFFFEEDQKIVNNDLCSFKKLYDLKYGQECCYSHPELFVVVGSVFVGSLPKKSSNLHVWDLETGSKLKEEECPLIGNYSLIKIVDSCTSEFAAVALASDKNDHLFTYLVYDPKRLSFLPFRQTIDQMNSPYVNCAINKHYIAVFEHIVQPKLHIYNIHSSEHIFECQIDEMSIGVVDDCFVFSTEGTTNLFSLRSRNRNILTGLSYIGEIGQRFLELDDSTQDHFIWKIKRSTAFKHLSMKDDSPTFSDINLLNHSFTRLLKCFNGEALYLNTFW